MINPLAMRREIVELQRKSEDELNALVGELLVEKYHMTAEDVARASMLFSLIVAKRMQRGG